MPLVFFACKKLQILVSWKRNGYSAERADNKEVKK